MEFKSYTKSSFSSFLEGIDGDRCEDDQLPSLEEVHVRPPKEAHVRHLFWIMCWTFAVVCGTATTPIMYASSLLPDGMGDDSNSVFYVLCVLSTLFVAPHTVLRFGSRNGILFGMISYMVYVALFTFAQIPCKILELFQIACEENHGRSLQWCLTMFGAAVGGIGGGLLWTGQGSYFASCSRIVASREDKEIAVLTDEFAGSFAIVFVGTEAVIHTFFTVCSLLSVDFFSAFLFSALMALASSLLFFCFSQEPECNNDDGLVRSSLCETVLSAVKLWRDRRIWLICFTNLAFGFSAGWLNGYVNANFQEKAFGGSKYVGFDCSITAFVAAVSAKFYTIVGFRGGWIFLGSCCFFGVAVLSTITWPNGEGPGGWGWGILVFYVVHGLGRGVYESTNKAIFAEMFPGDQSAGAFANCMMQSTLASSICFGMQGQPISGWIIWILILCSCINTPSYYLAECLHKRQFST